MKIFFALGFLIVSVYGRTNELYNAETIIKKVNDAKSTWIAGHNFAKDIPLNYIVSLLGALQPTNERLLPIKNHNNLQDFALPDSFDARKQWPNCSTISHIKDQGVCGSCWAVAAASAFSDRLCIATKGQFNTQLSEEELMTCCETCGFGCDGGYPGSAWNYFYDEGIVTGGDYHSNVGCQPYQIQPCEHHIKGKRPQCSTLPHQPTPDCERRCLNSDYKIDFKSDHHKVKRAYGVDGVKNIQKEILKNGPVEASFQVYADFPTYKTGVYQYVSGDLLGGHAVRVIGWGTEKGTPYWLIANSWNSDWGDNGIFKILRGKDECGIESAITAGLPDV